MYFTVDVDTILSLELFNLTHAVGTYIVVVNRNRNVMCTITIIEILCLKVDSYNL